MLEKNLLAGGSAILETPVLRSDWHNDRTLPAVLDHAHITLIMLASNRALLLVHQTHLPIEMSYVLGD